jgi:hypothetical protein
MPKTLTHGANADCPAVATGSATRCPGHTEVTPEERLHNAILSFAHAVNNDLDEVLRALNKDGQTELADDLLRLRGEWIDASQAAFDSFKR